MTNKSPYAYDNGTLINRFGIQDQDELQKAEAGHTAMRRMQLQVGLGPRGGEFDLEHLKALHRHLFQDVYEWAGTTRGELTTIEGQSFMPPGGLRKEDTQFMRADLISERLGRTFAELRQDDHLKGTTREEFAEKAAKLLADLNYAHPFREGNGRTQREFMSQLAAQAGHRLEWGAITQERMRVDSIQATPRYNAETGEAARNLDGLTQMFREITTWEQSTLLKEAITHLRNEGLNPNAVYLTAAQHGQTYEGERLEGTPKLGLVLLEGNKLLVAPPQSFQKAVETDKGIRFTASYDKGLSMEM